MRKQIKKAVALLLCVLLAVSAASVAAYAGSDPLSFALSSFVDNQYAMLVSCDTAASGKISVPAQVKIDGKTYQVKFIGEKAFANCTDITEITIPEGVTQIGSKAFENCTSLKTVNLPSTLMSCQYDAFNGCNTVDVNCYESNYQFFAVYGFSDNIHVNVIDGKLDQQETRQVNSFVDFIKQFFNWLINLFKKKSK